MACRACSTAGLTRPGGRWALFSCFYRSKFPLCACFTLARTLDCVPIYAYPCTRLLFHSLLAISFIIPFLCARCLSLYGRFFSQQKHTGIRSAFTYQGPTYMRPDGSISLELHQGIAKTLRELPTRPVRYIDTRWCVYLN